MDTARHKTDPKVRREFITTTARRAALGITVLLAAIL